MGFRVPSHGTVSPTFRVGLPSTVKPFWKHPQSMVLVVVLNPVGLTVLAIMIRTFTKAIYTIANYRTRQSAIGEVLEREHMASMLNRVLITIRKEEQNHVISRKKAWRV